MPWKPPQCLCVYDDAYGLRDPLHLTRESHLLMNEGFDYRTSPICTRRKNQHWNNRSLTLLAQTGKELRKTTKVT